METSIISCPQCGKAINVSDILYEQVKNNLKNDFDKQLALKEQDYISRKKELDTVTDQLMHEKELMQKQIDSSVKILLDVEKEKLEKSISQRLKDENSEQYKTLQNELNEKSLQVKELNQTKADVERLKLEKDVLRDNVEL